MKGWRAENWHPIWPHTLTNLLLPIPQKPNNQIASSLWKPSPKSVLGENDTEHTEHIIARGLAEYNLSGEMMTQMHKEHLVHGYAGCSLTPEGPQTMHWKVRGIHEESKKNGSQREQDA